VEDRCGRSPVPRPFLTWVSFWCVDDRVEPPTNRADRLTNAVRWFRSHAWVSVVVGILVEVGLAATFHHVPPSTRAGITAATAVLLPLVVALVNGPVAGCLVAAVGGVAFVSLVFRTSSSPPVGSGFLLVLVWVAIAALTGAVSERLRRRTTLALGVAAIAREEAEAARERAERLAARALVLQRMTAGLSEAVTVHDVSQVILGAGLNAMTADAGLLAVIDDDATSLSVVERRGMEETAVGVSGRVPLASAGLLTESMRARAPAFVGSFDELADRFPSTARAASTTGFRSWVVVPLVGSGPLGALCFAYARVQAFDPPEREALMTFASQCAQALERARLYEGQRRVAEMLQRSLLPERVETLPPIRVAVRYLAGGPNVEVGGDWYDLLPFPDGRLGVAIGDVVGRGTRAAAVMGHLRTALRAYALTHADPGAAIGALSRHLRVYGEVDLATLLYVTLEPGSGRLRYANAGHPPALIRAVDGATRFLDAPPAPPLGAGDPGGHATWPEDLGEGEIAILYTDGLIERRGESIDEGLARLADAVRAAPREPEALCDHILGTLHGGQDLADDVAVITLVRDPVPARLRLRLPARPTALPALRQNLRSWMATHRIPDDAASDIVIAVSEAANNAIEHAFAAAEGAFEVDASLDGDAVLIDVFDDGTWRGRSPTPQVTTPDVAPSVGAKPGPGNGDHGGRDDGSATPATGRGIDMMRATMDDVRIERTEGGTRVRMRRRITVRP
jgi:anti-sigma regulatory factor (Ser/Thr protein kinase)